MPAEWKEALSSESSDMAVSWREDPDQRWPQTICQFLILMKGDLAVGPGCGARGKRGPYLTQA